MSKVDEDTHTQVSSSNHTQVSSSTHTGRVLYDSIVSKVDEDTLLVEVSRDQVFFFIHFFQTFFGVDKDTLLLDVSVCAYVCVRARARACVRVFVCVCSCMCVCSR